jgi:hypothetical protein
MKTKNQLYDELNNYFSSRKNLEKHFHLEGFLVDKIFIDEINHDIEMNDDLKSLLKFQLCLEQLNKKIEKNLIDLKYLIADKIDNAIEIKLKCDYLFEENQKLDKLFMRLNLNLKPEYTVKLIFDDFFKLLVKIQKYSLSRDNVGDNFKLIHDYLNKQQIDDSKIDIYRDKLIEIFRYNLQSKVALLNTEICQKNANILCNYYTLEEDGDFLFLSPKPRNLKPEKITKIKPKFLIDIWEPDKNGSKEYYDKVIEKLKINFNKFDNPLIIIVNDELHWNLIFSRGSRTYLAGFIKTCIDKKWILNNYSAPEYADILKNTFINLKTLDPRPFRNVSLFNKAEYIEPFDFIKENK